MGDLSTDKFTFKTNAYPSADGTNKIFATGDYLLIEASLKVYLNGTETAPASVDAVNGTFTMTNAPAAETVILASYNYQWFDDDVLLSFLTSGANTVGVDDYSSDTLVIGLRPVVLHFASYFAYMKKAAEVADALVATAEGFDVDQSKSFPNWKRMAENAWEAATKALQFYNDNVLKVGGVGMAIVSYKMPNYVPRS